MACQKVAIPIAALFIGIASGPFFTARGAEKISLSEVLATIEAICQRPSEGQTSTDSELSGEAKIKLNGLLKKFADAGITSAGKYRSNVSNGVLQKDLAAAIKDGNKCSQNMFDKLNALFQIRARLPGESSVSRRSAQREGRALEVTIPPSGLVRLPVGAMDDGQTMRLCMPATIGEVASTDLLRLWLVPSEVGSDGGEPSIGSFNPAAGGSCSIDGQKGRLMESNALAGGPYAVVLRQAPNGLVGAFNRVFSNAGVRAYDYTIKLTIRKM